MLSSKPITPRKIRVLLIDDSAILLREAVAFLSHQPDIELIESVHKAANALAQTELHTPDVVLLDITTSGAHGLHTIHELHTVHPLLPIIVLDEIEIETIRRSALARGAVSFMPKTAARECLFPAILKGVGGSDRNA